MVSRGGTPLPEPLGGADVFALRQSIALANRGAEVVLVAPGDLPSQGVPVNLKLLQVPTERTYQSRWKVIYFAKAFSLAIWTALRATGYLRRNPAKVVHCHHAVSVILLRMLTKRTTLVYSIHDQPYSSADKREPFLSAAIRIVNNLVLEKLASRLADGLFVVSPPIEAMVRSWGVPTNRCALTPMIVLGSTTPPLRVDGTEWRPQAPECPFVLSVGALTGRKRFDLLIRALALTKPDRRLVVVGRGPLKDELVRLCDDLGVAQRVKWIDSARSEELLWLIRKALFLTLASDREGNPTILYEALWEGTPIVYFGGGASVSTVGGPYFTQLQNGNPSAMARIFDEQWDYWYRNRGMKPEIQSWARASLPSPDLIAIGMIEVYLRLLRLDATGLSPRPPA